MIIGGFSFVVNEISSSSMDSSLFREELLSKFETNNVSSIRVIFDSENYINLSPLDTSRFLSALKNGNSLPAKTRQYPVVEGCLSIELKSGEVFYYLASVYNKQQNELYFHSWNYVKVGENSIRESSRIHTSFCIPNMGLWFKAIAPQEFYLRAYPTSDNRELIFLE